MGYSFFMLDPQRKVVLLLNNVSTSRALSLIVGAGVKDHIHRAPLLSEATLALRHNIIQYVLGDPVQHDKGQYLACNAEEADPAVAVAGRAITLVFVQVDDVGIPEVLWELTIDPEHLEHPGKVSDKSFTTGFEHLSWYSIWSLSLACLQLFDGCISLCCVRWGIEFWDHGALLNGLQITKNKEGAGRSQRPRV